MCYVLSTPTSTPLTQPTTDGEYEYIDPNLLSTGVPDLGVEPVIRSPAKSGDRVLVGVVCPEEYPHPNVDAESATTAVVAVAGGDPKA